MTGRRSRIAMAVAAAWVFGAGGCVTPEGEVAGGPGALPPASGDLLVPAGYGSLRQEDFTVTLRAGDVQIKVTPLAEWVIRLAAPDTYRRLSGAVERLAVDDVRGRLPVLVSFHTDVAGGAPVEARDLVLWNRGRAFRPEGLRGLSSDWGSGRLSQRETQQAVYLFDDEVDLEMELEVEFDAARSAEWSRILPRLQTERARVRARARGQSSRSNFLILR